ncbi:MAG TPA: hypothetical protein VKD70_17285 [Candidatus Acidoferrum sp.]|nr:hypothetical protein [Candidatus Acidoferrum sp.]
MHFELRAIHKKTPGVLKFAFAVCLIPFFLPLLAQPAKEKTKSFSAGPKLTLRVYNYAGLDPSSLASSEKVATSIFQNVGIDPVWVDCPTSKLNAVAYQACDSPMGPADFVLRILPRNMASKVRHSQDALGFAQICSVSEPACELNIFYHRIDDWATKGYRADRILGYAIAHEVGHILVGPSHSDDGIMRASWSPSDLGRISLGLQLDFSRDQSAQLRIALLHRFTPSQQDATIQVSLAR